MHDLSLFNDSQINAVPLHLGNISKTFWGDNTKTTRLYGYIYDFSVDCDVTAVDDKLDIHRYSLKKNDICAKR